MYDCLIVGAGLSGSVIARYLAEEKNKKVLVLEKRKHIAGNVYDCYNEDNILVQLYGPHIFHTSKQKVIDYVNRWGKWENYSLECMVYMEGKYTPSPFNFKTIDDFFPEEKAAKIKKHIKNKYGNAPKATIVELLESEDDTIREYARFLFEHDYSLYTAKQWGISPEKIDIEVLKRVPVLFSYKKEYFDDTYQAMPTNGFTSVVAEILNHNNITVQMETNAVDRLELNYKDRTVLFCGEKLPIIYTGAIDELMKYVYGRLPYRSLKFEWKTINKVSFQKAAVVAYPEADGYTRITEYTKLPLQVSGLGKTTIAIEYPVEAGENSEQEPYYPIPTAENNEKYVQYRKTIDEFENIMLCGRLAEYKYYNVDQVIENALNLCKKL